VIPHVNSAIADNLQAPAPPKENSLPEILAAVEAYATVGESPMPCAAVGGVPGIVVI